MTIPCNIIKSAGGNDFTTTTLVQTESVTSRDGSWDASLLAAYADRRRCRLHKLNVWLSQAMRPSSKEEPTFNTVTQMLGPPPRVVGAHDDSRAESHHNQGIADMRDGNAAFPSVVKEDSVVTVESCCHTSFASVLPHPSPELEYHPDDVYFMSCRDFTQLVDVLPSRRFSS